MNSPETNDSRKRRLGLALSGGGSRAIAFHLGCLRALQDASILEKVEVISAVSGGAVLAALYAYSDNEFAEFDAEVVRLLKSGLQAGILTQVLHPGIFLGSIATWLVAGTSALGATVIRESLIKAFGANPSFRKIQPPFRRWISRTNGLERVLAERFFRNLKMSDVRRPNLDVVLNAADLRTGTSFRFGNRESGNWRFGAIHQNEVLVAQAVTSSAAYPALLPALDVEFNFEKGGVVTPNGRVLLTDGGVYDNLGVTCFDPQRTDSISYNVYHPEHIICCYAGHGQLDGIEIPFFWPGRMKRSFDVVFRRVQESGMHRLHEILESEQIKSFVMSYLGQHDSRLHVMPSDLVSRADVAGYPTDFAPMTEENIEKLSKRGEQLMRLNLERYGSAILLV